MKKAVLVGYFSIKVIQINENDEETRHTERWNIKTIFMIIITLHSVLFITFRKKNALL